MLPPSSISLSDRLLALTPAFLRSHWDRLRASPLGYRLAKGALWSLAGAAISRGLQLVSTIFVARMLGKESYGELGIIQSTVGMFGVFAGFGMGLTANKHVAEYRTSDPDKAGRIVVLTEWVTLGASLLLLAVLACSAPFLARETLAAPHLAPLLMLGGLLLPLGALNGVQTGALSGLEAFRVIARVNLFAGLLSFPLMVGGTYAAGITGAVLALAASQAINCVLSHVALRREAGRFGFPMRPSGLARELRIVWSFSVPSVLSNAAPWCANWACSAMLVNQASGYAEMGVVNVGIQWRNALLFLPAMLVNATLPILSNERPKPDSDFSRTLSLSHKLLVPMVLPIAFALMMVSGQILGLYGRAFQEGRIALIYLLAAAAISAVSSPAGSAIIALGKMWLAFALNASNALLFLLLTYSLIPSAGAAGLAFAFLAGQLLQAVAGYLYLRPYLARGMLVRNLAAIAVICLFVLAVSHA